MLGTRPTSACWASSRSALLCLGIAVLTLSAPRRPRLAQICFLALAAFMMTNKVWSPQFVLWLVPFAVLARPNWKPLALWQVAECWYFFAIWLYLVVPAAGQTRTWASATTPTSPPCGGASSRSLS